MAKTIDSNTRFYIDIDINTKKVLNWDYDDRQKLSNPHHRRIFISKGQYNKLEK